MFTLRLCELNDNFSRLAFLNGSRFQDCLSLYRLLPNTLYSLLCQNTCLSFIFFHTFTYVVASVSIFPSGKSLITIYESAQMLLLLRRVLTHLCLTLKIRSFHFFVYNTLNITSTAAFISL